MKFHRLSVRRFGRLKELETGSEPLGSLVSVYGPNEAGKSTLFSFLTTVLYGIYPTRRDQHPYAPWSGDDLDAQAELLLSDGREVTVQRRLLSSPLGELRSDGKVDKLANRNVPWVGHVPRELFRRLYALTLRDMAALEEDQWQEVQDRLLGAMGAEDIRPIRSVVKELEDEAGKLWRPSRLGKQKAEALEDRRRELQGLRQEARERDRTLRTRIRELAELNERLKTAKEERFELQGRVDRAQRLKPVRDTLRVMGREEERMGDPDELKGLPSDPGEAVESLEAGVKDGEERVERLEARMERDRERVAEFGDGHRRLLDRSAEIRSLGKEAGEIGFTETRGQGLRSRIEALSRRSEELARELFADPRPEALSDALGDFPMGELRQRVADYRKARAEVSDQEGRMEALRDLEPPPPSPVTSWAGAGLSAVGAALLVASALGDARPWNLEPAVMGVPGALLLVTGLALVGLRLLRGRALARHQRAVSKVRSELEGRARDAEERLERVLRVLEPLPVAPAHLEAPDVHLVQTLEKLQEVRGDLRRAREEEERLQKKIHRGRDRLQELAEDVGVQVPENLREGVVLLEEALEKAQTLEGQAERARESLEETKDELAEAQEKLATNRERLEGLTTRLREMGDGDLQVGLSQVGERLEARSRVQHFRAELRNEHPDLDEIREEIREAEAAGESWAVDERGLARDRERIQELNEEEKVLGSRITALEAELDDLRTAPTPDALDGEIEAVEEELAQVRRRRDRLCLLAELLRTADHRFREENQPDVIRRASAHLSRITDGRYDEIWLREGDLDGTLLLRGPGYPQALEVDHDSVSTGTREQVYLALRLAIVDHLDQGAETLPLFIDEAFVNWDRGRRHRGLDLLQKLSRERQVFVFTCHRTLADELLDRGARVLELPGA